MVRNRQRAFTIQYVAAILNLLLGSIWVTTTSESISRAIYWFFVGETGLVALALLVNFMVMVRALLNKPSNASLLLSPFSLRPHITFIFHSLLILILITKDEHYLALVWGWSALYTVIIYLLIGLQIIRITKS